MAVIRGLFRRAVRHGDRQCVENRHSLWLSDASRRHLAELGNSRRKLTSVARLANLGGNVARRLPNDGGDVEIYNAVN